uniref:Serine protease n=1 Tax=Bosea sp. NBC_00436 TaxID=2969620 RepID=A0A9E8CLM3_9HYPH
MSDHSVKTDSHPWGGRYDLHEIFRKYDDCIVRVRIKQPDGDFANGTAFHIGGGAFVTAAHVVRGNSDVRLFLGDTHWKPDDGWSATGILYHSDMNVDVAIILSELWREFTVDHETEFKANGEKPQFIEVPEMYGEWIEDSLVLTRGVICGYPKVPRSNGAYKLAVSAEINADVQRYDVPNVHFIVSSTARGGFSGAPFISEFDMLLGVVTDALSDDSQESPFMAVVAIEAVYDILEQNEAALKGRMEHYLATWSKPQKELAARLPRALTKAK